MDRDWWRMHADEVASFAGEKLCPLETREARQLRSVQERNSGCGAIRLAALRGARRIVLLGYDCQKTGGAAHWHPDHPTGLGNAGSLDKWPAQFAQLAASLPGIEVINCTRQTALTCWPRADLDATLSGNHAPHVRVQGMGGLGDCIMQRAIVSDLMREYRVTLETPWPELYHDIRGDRLACVPKGTRLRTQSKHMARADFDDPMAGNPARNISVSYPPAKIREHRGVVKAMAAQCGTTGTDFALPVPDDWRHGLDLPTDRPVILYRPLVERSEWRAASRNPEAAAYVAVLNAIREQSGAYVISVADLEQGKEWVTSPAIGADLELHCGELSLTELAALTRDADLVFAAPGFAVVLAQAVGTPVISMFGGYQMAYTLPDSDLTLKIDPDKPCDCFTHTHGCGQKTNIERAKRLALEFMGAKCLLKS